MNEKGIPTEVSVTHLTPPRSVMGPATDAQVQSILSASSNYTKYQEEINRESAYEMLSVRMEQQMQAVQAEEKAKAEEKAAKAAPGGGKSIVQEVLGSTMARQIGREVVRGLFNMLLKGGKK